MGAQASIDLLPPTASGRHAAGEALVQNLAIVKGLSVRTPIRVMAFWVQRHAAGEAPVQNLAIVKGLSVRTPIWVMAFWVQRHAGFVMVDRVRQASRPRDPTYTAPRAANAVMIEPIAEAHSGVTPPRVSDGVECMISSQTEILSILVDGRL